MKIFEGLLNKNKLKIEDNAKEEIRKIVYESSKIENFGNARFINKIYQNLLIEHAKNTDSTINMEDLFTIKLIDVNKEKLIAKDDQKKRIGF